MHVKWVILIIKNRNLKFSKNYSISLRKLEISQQILWGLYWFTRSYGDKCFDEVCDW